MPGDTTASVACWLLIWQQPTDRALAGWCADPALTAVATWPARDAVPWLAIQIGSIYEGE